MPPISRTEKGKPYFAGETLYFSVTHTKKYAFCALSDRPVGVDAEELSRKVNPGLAEKILSQGELLQYYSASDQNRALLTFWVLKEAEAKCTGEGIRIHPNHTAFSLTDSRVREEMNCLVAVITKEKEEE
jgi:4'-phosphopantetheinyl transferase